MGYQTPGEVYVSASGFGAMIVDKNLKAGGWLNGGTSHIMFNNCLYG